ncbi:MAG: hypothetical protein HYT70_02505 [Candidatus Aenigmarchaeota archaeon]|nr:hypothetical protein [Candidatus Aenigmarchaeota archaeon]
MSRQPLQIDDKVIDEIVDEILNEGDVLETSPPMRLKPSNKIYKNSSKAGLQEKFEEHLRDYRTTAMELERQITEKSEEWMSEQEKQMMRLQGQIEDLRTSMIKLSSELKKLKDEFSK